MTLMPRLAAVSVLLSSPIVLVLFFLKLLEVIVEALEALFPELAVDLDPVADLLRRREFELAGPVLFLPRARDEAGALQDLEVFRDGGEREVERLGQFIDRGLAHGE